MGKTHTVWDEDFDDVPPYLLMRGRAMKSKKSKLFQKSEKKEDNKKKARRKEPHPSTIIYEYGKHERQKGEIDNSVSVSLDQGVGCEVSSSRESLATCAKFAESIARKISRKGVNYPANEFR